MVVRFIIFVVIASAIGWFIPQVIMSISASFALVVSIFAFNSGSSSLGELAKWLFSVLVSVFVITCIMFFFQKFSITIS